MGRSKKVKPPVVLPELPRDFTECDRTRKCPHVRCRYHLGLDIVADRTGRQRFYVKDVTAMEHTCALEVAEDGEHDFTAIGEYMGMHPERVRQFYNGALQKFRDALIQGCVPTDLINENIHAEIASEIVGWADVA